MKKILSIGIFIFITAGLYISCMDSSPNRQMADLLSDIANKNNTFANVFAPDARVKFFDSVMASPSSRPSDIANAEYFMGTAALLAGNEQKSVASLESLLQRIPVMDLSRRRIVLHDLAIAYMRLGERMNCVYDHREESCIFPLSAKGIHYDKTGSEKAIAIYRVLLENDPEDLESMWLLNVAYMTTGGYPHNVPERFLLKGLNTDTITSVKPFIDVAVNIGMHTKNMAGGSLVEDMNNDDYLDIVTSSWSLNERMHYCRNNFNGTFTDISDSSGLGLLSGGLNIMQTDYNNDGLKDIHVLRGAWKGKFGNEPSSLLRNNGNGTFSDVTQEAGMLAFFPTQTATWADFDNDGWLDVFIGAESTAENYHYSKLYMNNKNGTFKEVASVAGVGIADFVKGVTSGDYNNDGLTDIFISTLTGNKFLFKNEGLQTTGTVHFKDVSSDAGISSNHERTFPTWFFDYNNDGWQDILICSYEFDKSLAWYAAAEAMGKPIGKSGRVILFENKKDGTFENVSEKAGLTKIAFAMGSNFGDIDNDGYPDFYLGTGNPQYQSLVPNKFFKNVDGKGFIDATTAARMGNLQKGHGVSFADMDNDGDADIHIDMGGAYAGDIYQNSLYINPGQNNNRWINMRLEGTTCNKPAIGARIKVTFKENNVERSVYTTVNSGGSFGANPLVQHIGIGQATAIDRIEIKWPGSSTVQVVKNVQPGDHIKVKQGVDKYTKVTLLKVDYTAQKSGLISCSPK